MEHTLGLLTPPPDTPRHAPGVAGLGLAGIGSAVLFKIRHNNAAVAKQAALAGAEREVAEAEVKQRLKLRLSRLSGLRNRRGPQARTSVDSWL